MTLEMPRVTSLNLSEAQRLGLGPLEFRSSYRRGKSETLFKVDTILGEQWVPLPVMADESDGSELLELIGQTRQAAVTEWRKREINHAVQLLRSEGWTLKPPNDKAPASDH